MAYVVPNTQLQLFKGINLDNRYMHTVHFASEAVQDAAFTAKVFKNYNDLMFRRYTDNQVKVEADATTLQGVTYMRFKNSRTNNKWYYAFVLACDYINENTSIITYEIDVMQTWFEQGGSVLPCIIIREHVNSDAVGEHIESEPVMSEVIDYDYIQRTGNFQHNSVILSTTDEPQRNMYCGLYNGTDFTVLPADDETDGSWIKAAINQALGSWDKRTQKADIVDLYTFPTHYAENLEPTTETIEVNKPTEIDGYTPKNKKLLTYPYTFLFATTQNGDSHIYRWEYWVQLKALFHTIACPTGGGMISCYPTFYNGIDENCNEGLIMNDFPKNSANIDAYQAWVAAGGQTRLQDETTLTKLSMASRTIDFAQGVVQNTLQAGSGILTAAQGVLVANPIGGVAAGSMQIAGAATNQIKNSIDYAKDIKEAQNKIAYQWKDASYRPNIVVGKNTPNLGMAYHTLDFYFYTGHVTLQEMKKIDDFFSVYGYAIHDVKTPNLTGRQYWNFVQTENCQIAGDMPASSKEAIGRIFDGGITIWHNIDQIGNYAQSTSAGTINNPIV